ncbi:hypothetical protein HMPREF9444_00395 [Succinatimonas hippei YIT 12066]|uniref:Uncharacterized protein n=1 Tax=Succinatimonas hippei (strain DSM 22608 / JCM 16073 / KCTC 15190 / YIT 12066) TaxID=762983 RepID=E8LI80_SUCHY|nr:hypothetical protein HMPREF9444_00395 [Succinatimonas hippei YIT 12066]
MVYKASPLKFSPAGRILKSTKLLFKKTHPASCGMLYRKLKRTFL